MQRAGKHQKGRESGGLAVIFGKIDGSVLHRFFIHGHTVLVVRGHKIGKISVYEENSGFISTIAPPGISYHQAALEAVTALEKGKYK